jgi:hypothetical protein
MKAADFLLRRPWLLVVAAFVILIAAWVTVIQVSRLVPNQRLTPSEEARWLGGKGGRP